MAARYRLPWMSNILTSCLHRISSLRNGIAAVTVLLASQLLDGHPGDAGAYPSMTEHCESGKPVPKSIARHWMPMYQLHSRRPEPSRLNQTAITIRDDLQYSGRPPVHVAACAHDEAGTGMDIFPEPAGNTLPSKTPSCLITGRRFFTYTYYIQSSICCEGFHETMAMSPFTGTEQITSHRNRSA